VLAESVRVRLVDPQPGQLVVTVAQSLLPRVGLAVVVVAVTGGDGALGAGRWSGLVTSSPR